MTELLILLFLCALVSLFMVSHKIMELMIGDIDEEEEEED